MGIFKKAYKIKRETSDEIYQGFGFKHLSDATMYYVHPDNQSAQRKTTLCQQIGESVTMFASLLAHVTQRYNDVQGEIYVLEGDTSSLVVVECYPSLPWRQQQVIAPEVACIRVMVQDKVVALCVYDENGDEVDEVLFVDDDYTLKLAAFVGLLAYDMITHREMSELLLAYVQKPAADTFVMIHENFYQSHKFDSIQLNYVDDLPFDATQYQVFSDMYKIKLENEQATSSAVPVIHRLDENQFDQRWLLLIPRLAAEFELPAKLASTSNAIASGDVLAVLLHGPSGTGKTISCKLICQAIGLPLVDTVNCTENLDEFVLGKFIPEGEQIVFKESFVTQAIRFGGAVVFEEINFAKPQYLAFLNSLLDDNGFVRLDNGELVRRHRHFRFFATMNRGYYGTKELNQALYNRFNAIVEIDALSDEAIRKMLLARVPECAPVVDKLLSVYHKIKYKIQSEELDFVISPRNLENWAKLAKYEGYVQAAEKTIIPIAQAERIFEEAIRGIVVLHKWKMNDE